MPGQDPGRLPCRSHVQQYVDAGFDHIVLQNAGPDPEGFVDFFTRELADGLRSLTPAA